MSPRSEWMYQSASFSNHTPSVWKRFFPVADFHAAKIS
jgi:hypothetical protein